MFVNPGVGTDGEVEAKGAFGVDCTVFIHRAARSELAVLADCGAAAHRAVVSKITTLADDTAVAYHAIIFEITVLTDGTVVAYLAVIADSVPLAEGGVRTGLTAIGKGAAVGEGRKVTKMTALLKGAIGPELAVFSELAVNVKAASRAKLKCVAKSGLLSKGLVCWKIEMGSGGVTVVDCVQLCHGDDIQAQPDGRGRAGRQARVFGWTVVMDQLRIFGGTDIRRRTREVGDVRFIPSIVAATGCFVHDVGASGTRTDVMASTPIGQGRAVEKARSGFDHDGGGKWQRR